jgi:outer membrane protein assembly factor BamD
LPPRTSSDIDLDVTRALLFVLLVATACSSFETNLQDTDVEYEGTARQNFDKGEEAFQRETYAEAIKFFEHTKNKFPYSKYAVLAELRIADAHFARKKWIEAADAYKIFVRFHPRDEKAAYATFRVALAYSNEIPQDVWFFPSARERDQSAARDAIRAFDEYLSRFPNDEHAAEAKKLRVAARARLAETDLYAADFYAEREKWQGALWRYQRVAEEFGDTPEAPRALLRAAQIAGEKLALPQEATAFYEKLVKEHPTTPEAVDAKKALASLGARSGSGANDDASAPKTDAAPPASLDGG